MAIPDSKKIYPREGDYAIVYLKNVITNQNIEVGDFVLKITSRKIRKISKRKL